MNSAVSSAIWLRFESKYREDLKLYDPDWVQGRVNEGFKVYVEKGKPTQGPFDDADYEEAGAILIPKGGSRLAKKEDQIF